MSHASVIVVKAARDADAGVWFVETSDIPGLCIEAKTIEEMINKLPDAIADLLECQDDGLEYDLPIELIAHASTRVKAREAA